VRCSNVAGLNSGAFHLVTEPHEVGYNGVQPSSHECRDVLDDDDARSELTDDTRKLAPQTASLPCQAELSSCLGYVLTGETAADDVDCGQIVSCSHSDIRHAPISIRPMLLEHRTAPCILLDLPNRMANTGHLQAEFKTTDSGK